MGTKLPKYLADRIQRIDASRCIVLLAEKHATSYYDPRDWGGILLLSLHIFQRRGEMGYFPKEAPVNGDSMPEEWELLVAARNGDPVAAYRLLELRQDHEYEGFEVEDLETPSRVHGPEK